MSELLEILLLGWHQLCLVGATYDGGISAIRIATNNRDWEVDRLQYGAASPAPVPEPSTILMVGAGAASLRRKRLKKGKKLRQE
jgi:hypothetical protein